MFKVGDRVKKKNGTPFRNDKIYDTVHKMFNGNQVYLNETGSWIGIEDIELDVDSVSPIRTVTRREIVPGTYGCVEVDVHSFGMNVVADFSGGKCTPEELREAAHIFNQIAEVLEENAK